MDLTAQEKKFIAVSFLRSLLLLRTAQPKDMSMLFQERVAWLIQLANKLGVLTEFREEARSLSAELSEFPVERN